MWRPEGKKNGIQLVAGRGAWTPWNPGETARTIHKMPQLRGNEIFHEHGKRNGSLLVLLF